MDKIVLCLDACFLWAEGLKELRNSVRRRSIYRFHYADFPGLIDFLDALLGDELSENPVFLELSYRPESVRLIESDFSAFQNRHSLSGR